MNQQNEKESFFIVPMLVATELKLKGAEMIVYSIIYSFSQNGTSFFYGSIDYMCRATNLDKRTIIRTLKSLLDQNLIAKKDIKDLRQYGIDKVANGAQHFCVYYTTKGYELPDISMELFGRHTEIRVEE